jgi:hypothetical protein
VRSGNHRTEAPSSLTGGSDSAEDAVYRVPTIFSKVYVPASGSLRSWPRPTPPNVSTCTGLQACIFAINEVKKANGSRHPCAWGCLVSEGRTTP